MKIGYSLILDIDGYYWINIPISNAIFSQRSPDYCSARGETRSARCVNPNAESSFNKSLSLISCI